MHALTRSASLAFICAACALRLSWVQGCIVSAAIVAAALGAALGGRLSDRYGRKRALLGADVLFAVGAAAMGWLPMLLS